MPIRPDLRHFYRGPAWRAVRERILARAKNRCEPCGKRRHERVWVVCGYSDSAARGELHAVSFSTWIPPLNVRGEVLLDEFYARSKHDRTVWRSCRLGGVRVRFSLCGAQWKLARRVYVKVGVAHLDHDPANNADDNLRALCDWCHLRHDAPKHRDTRAARKDAARPIQWEGGIAV